MESVPPASAVNVMPEASVVGEAPAEQLPSSLQQREFEHLQSNRPHTSVPPQSAADRLMSSAAIPPQVEASPQTAALKNDLDALIGKAEAAQKLKQEVKAVRVRILKKPSAHISMQEDDYRRVLKTHCDVSMMRHLRLLTLTNEHSNSIKKSLRMRTMRTYKKHFLAQY